LTARRTKRAELIKLSAVVIKMKLELSVSKMKLGLRNGLSRRSDARRLKRRRTARIVVARIWPSNRSKDVGKP